MAKKKRRQYSREFKTEICALVLKGQKTVPEVCSEYDLTESGVYAWVRQAKIWAYPEKVEC